MKKDLHDPDSHDGVIKHLESNILECEVKWALGNTTMNKTSGGEEIPVELLQILKNDVVKVLQSICQKIWKMQQWPQDWKRSFFIAVSKKGNVKEYSSYHTIALISVQFSSVTQSCPTLQPHRRQPTRLPHLWDSPGKNTGVGCHCLLHERMRSVQLCSSLSILWHCLS